MKVGGPALQGAMDPGVPGLLRQRTALPVDFVSTRLLLPATTKRSCSARRGTSTSRTEVYEGRP
ncbi:hypothetical protein ACRAWD_27640 [Caulobacter segnis]